MSRPTSAWKTLPTLLAAVSGVVAAWLIYDYTESVANADGEHVSVLVAAKPIKAGQQLGSGEDVQLVASRSIPAKYSPPDAIGTRTQLKLLRAAADIEAGAFLTQSLFTAPSGRGGFRLRRGERAVTVGAKVAPDGAETGAGQRVDLIASSERDGGNSELILSGAEVLASPSSEHAAEEARITVRVRASQASRLIRADVFARELRAVVVSR